ISTAFCACPHTECHVRTDWLHRVAMRLPEVGDAILTGRVEPEGGGIVLTVKTADEPMTYRSPLIAGDVLFPPNMAFAVRLLERVGWLDAHPSLATAGEDNEEANTSRQA